MGNKENPHNKPEIIEKNVFNTIEWEENITILDLSNRAISNFDENLKLPPNLVILNLSNNKFTGVPETILKQNKLRTLDISFNNIELFDKIPNFCHTIESLNLSNNKLQGPPYWVWAEQPKKLTDLNISDNHYLCETLTNQYSEELLQYTTLVNRIDLYNCKLGKHLKLLSTFKHAKIVNLGSSDYKYFCVNFIETIPCIGLQDCCNIEILNLCNTQIYNIQNNIDIYYNLIEIDLSQNNINGLPNEFCNLENLEICILSHNKILYLPDDVHKLKKLKKLYLSNNDLCMIPDSLPKLENLKVLDLYNNNLYEGFDDISNLEEYDFAQNYNEEPSDEEYLERKRKLRDNLINHDRLDGRLPNIIEVESDQESKETDSEVTENGQPDLQEADTRCSTPEDWDSDDYWIPSHVDLYPSKYLNYKQTNNNSPCMKWLEYVEKKIAEGNFCPIDIHPTHSIEDKVRYEKELNSQPQQEVEGQFDDFSDDDS